LVGIGDVFNAVARHKRSRALTLPQFLEAASPRQILARVLRKLKGIYLRSEQAQNMLQAMRGHIALYCVAIRAGPGI
jgi:regulator of sirC expression with transglutaminase-like and TPR domain